MALGCCLCRILGGHLYSEPRMTVYDKRQLQELLGVGSATAYRVLKEHGFRIGNSPKSPFRITDEGVREYVQQARNELDKRP